MTYRRKYNFYIFLYRILKTERPFYLTSLFNPFLKITILNVLTTIDYPTIEQQFFKSYLYIQLLNFGIVVRTSKQISPPKLLIQIHIFVYIYIMSDPPVCSDTPIPCLRLAYP